MKRKAEFVVPETRKAFGYKFGIPGDELSLGYAASARKSRDYPLMVRIISERDWKRVIKLAKSAKQVKRGK